MQASASEGGDAGLTISVRSPGASGKGAALPKAAGSWRKPCEMIGITMLLPEGSHGYWLSILFLPHTMEKILRQMFLRSSSISRRICTKGQAHMQKSSA